MEMTDLLHAATDSGASDILLVSGVPPMFRIRGELEPAPLEALTPKEIEHLCRQVLSEAQYGHLVEHKDVDFSLGVPRLGRFRINIHWQRGALAAAIRSIPANPPDLRKLNLPPALEDFTRLPHGLVLVTGQTGSGKTTTLAGLLELINQRDSKHIITLEDPIEFQFAHARSVFEQREIGTDCPSFASGLRHVLRQDPDVILVGELRDLETIRVTLQAAETGHLVFGTLHSSSAPGAIDRIIEVFPAAEQSQIRSHLAECLRGVVTQRLLPTCDGKRVAAVEILTVTRAVQTSVREGTTHLIPGYMATGRRNGMQTMEQSVKELLLNGRIPPEAAEELLPEFGRALAHV